MLARDKLGVIDIEASGLGSHSYPIEIGISLSNGQQYQALIQPLADWSHWDQEAEALHGISRSDLFLYGKSLQEVCREINNLCAGQTLYSDCWVYDNTWLHQLFARAGMVPAFSCSPIESALSERQTQRYTMCKSAVSQHLGLRQHRALNDALTIQKALYVLMTQNSVEPARRVGIEADSPVEIMSVGEIAPVVVAESQRMRVAAGGR